MTAVVVYSSPHSTTVLNPEPPTQIPLVSHESTRFGSFFIGNNSPPIHVPLEEASRSTHSWVDHDAAVPTMPINHSESSQYGANDRPATSLPSNHAPSQNAKRSVEVAVSGELPYQRIDNEHDDMCRPTIPVNFSTDDSYPNGGWGWFVVFGSFLCMFIIDGLCCTYGLYMYEMISEGQFSIQYSGGEPVHQDQPLAALSIPGALFCGTYLLIGPLVGALVNRFGNRPIAALGATIATMSILVCALFVHDILWFTILFGLCGGIGCGLTYLPAITVIGYWFGHRRAIVVGLAMCGGGVGTIILAAVIQPLSRSVAWRGAFLLTAGLFSQTIVSSALFRSVCTYDRICAIKRERERENLKRLQAERARLVDTMTRDLLLTHVTELGSHIQRGSIMARIIEEKSRQRTTSTGSLDGMVITRNNEIISISPEAQQTVMDAVRAYANQELVAPADDSAQSAQSTCQDTVVVQNHDVAILPPPIQFSRPAVRRIARAILRKLHAHRRNSSRHSSLMLHPMSIPTILFNSDYRPLPERSDRMVVNSKHASFSGDWSQPTNLSSAANQSSPPILTSKSFVSKPKYRSELSPFSAMNVAMEPRRSVNEQTSLRQVGLVGNKPIDLSQTTSHLTSVISLDSCTDRLILRELQCLRLDEQTKTAILTVLRAELTRPKYRADLFYCGSPRAIPNNDLVDSGILSVEVGESGHFVSLDRLPSITIEPTAPERSTPQSVYATDCFVEADHADASVKSFSTSSPFQQCWSWILQRHHGPNKLPTDSPHDDVGNEPNEFVDYLRDMLHLRLLYNKTFLMLLFACALNMSVLMVPLHYLPFLLEFGGMECSINRLWCPNGLPHQSTDLGYSWLRDAIRWSVDRPCSTFFLNPGSILVTMGFACVVGRILAALYIEKRPIHNRCINHCFPCLKDPLNFNIVCIILSGLSLACIPLSIHGVIMEEGPERVLVQAWSIGFRVVLIYVAASVHGLTTAISFSLRSVILVELLGIEHLTNAIGHLLVFQGLAVICGPPLIGYFCDLACSGHIHLCSHHALVDFNQTAPHVHACAVRLIQAFYVCSSVFVITGLLFVPLRRLARHPPWSPPCLSRTHQQDPSLVVYNEAGHSSTSVNSRPRDAIYNPQDTQTTQIYHTTS